MTPPDIGTVGPRRAAYEDFYPLAPLQKGLLFHTVEGDDPGVYVVQLHCVLAAGLDVEAFRRAWERIVARHAALRTAFVWRGVKEPVQVVQRDARPELRVEDWSALDEDGRRTGLERFLGEDRAAGFALERAPLLRLALFRGEAGWDFVWSTHHAVVDGWCLPLIVRELVALYEGYVAGREAELPRPPRPYRDFVAWLHRRDGAATERFWRGELGSFEAPTLLAQALPAPEGEGGGHAEHWEVLGEAETEELRAAARRGRVTLGTLAQGAWALVLGRYCGAEDVLYGATVSGRPAELVGAEEMVGLFINTLPVRVAVPGEAEAGAWLGELQERLAELRGYEHTPLVEVQGWSGVARGEALFDTLFVFENYALGDAASVGETALGVREVRTEERTGYPVTVSVLPAGPLAFRYSYDRGRIAPEAVERLGEHVVNVLRALAGSPEVRLGEISLLSEAERAQVVEGWSVSGRAAAPWRCVHELFAEQAARTPGAVALVFGDERVTYAELDRRSDGLARRLAGLGVGPDVRVGICAERSPELVAGLLGILKAGGAYVPLDPAYPAERLAYMLADSAVPVLLVQERLLDRLPEFGGETVLLDGEESGEEGLPAPGVRVTADHLCYVIYTSGSTGRPKGTEVPHRAIPGFFWDVEYARFDERTVLLQHASISWDVLTLELWPALLRGGTSVLLPAQTSEPALLGEQVREHGVTATWISSAYFNSIVDTTPEVLSGLEQVMIGGEAVSVAHVRRAQALHPELRIVNGYGPSECTVFASCYPVPPGFDAATIPIGKPIGDRRVYLLDRYSGLVPVGVAGELCVGGPAVARGYLNRPELTAERFVPDPFSAEAGARMYRTGDRVRWRADGVLEFVGRMDQQVKVRGFRVEPGEVEGVLASHPGVREAAVVVREDATGAKALMGYAAAPDVRGAELREWLRERLPEHMLPSAVVVVEAMPLTPHGKLDRRALPEPDGAGAEEGYVAPRSPAEELAAGVWAEVLGVERVGVEDSFYELGGHSLLAMRVASRVGELLGTEVGPGAVLEGRTVAGLVERVEAARRAGAGTPAPLAPLAPVPRDGPLPLSFAQQRLWFIHQMEPESPAYNMPFALRLKGALDPALVERSLAEVVRRHETLRTVFPVVDGEPVQVVREEGDVRLPVTDLRALPEGEREDAVRRHAAEEALRPFDLAAGPLLRSSLLHTADEEWVLLFTLHHVVGDGWSMGVLAAEVSELYTALSEGRGPRLPELPVQYADYSVWQRSWLSGGVLEAQLAWWREQLAGAPPLLELPTDRPRGTLRGWEGRSVELALPGETGAALAALSRREGATLFMTLLAAWQLLLARWSGQDDVSVGTPIAGRTRKETEPLIGFFVNTLVLRTHLPRALTFRGLLRRVRETTLGAYQHQDVPFERLVEELAGERSLTHAPLFQVMLALHDDAGAELALGDAVVEAAPVEASTAKFDLRLSLAGGERGIAGSLSYRPELWDASTTERMLGHFARVLEGIAAAPERHLLDLPLLAETERRQLLVEWNGTDDGFAGDLLIQDLVEAQARRTPEGAALRFQGEEVTYRELSRRTNHLARHLRRWGVGPEVRVGICMEPSLEMVLAVLGVLKGGGAYVPLDPDLPAERMGYLLADAGVELVLTQAALEARVVAHGVRTLSLDAACEAAAGESDAAPVVPLDPDNLAYVIYTSGSTGRPKGVLVEHRGVCNTVVELARVYSSGPGERNLAFAPLHFDASVADLFVALCSGATLVLAGRDAMLPGPDLLCLLREEAVTHLKITPSALAVLAVEDLPELRTLVVGGESCTADLMARWAPGRRFFNGYGATEASIRMTSSRYTDAGRAPPLGRPVRNTRLYVLDADLGPVPVGVAGEMYIGGVGIVRGYLGQPELTAGRFVPDPFSAVPGARLYRTGDLGRRRADGELEFLGRVDFQVKVRGFRVELGEIEATLRERAGAQEAVVLLREDPAGDPRLVAYLVPGPEGALSARELREVVRERLPEYMVPSAFVSLDALPLTANGKVDRRALPAPEVEAGTDAVAPRTPAEEIVAGIWAEVLKLERVGVSDSFFDLGGHSLLATRVVTRLRASFGVELPLRTLFEAPTVGALAARVDALREDGAGVRVPPLAAVPRDRPLPLSFAQQRLWFLDQLQPGSAAYNIPHALRLRGALDPALLARALSTVVARHEALRTVFAMVDVEPVQVIREAAPVALPATDLRGLPAPEREAIRLATEEALRPFDLAAGPLLRARLLRLADEEWALLFTLHHVVSDGWSTGVLVAEVSELYTAFTEGREPALPELPVQYADFAVWQREWLSGDVLETQLGWWRERLAGAPPLLELPTDRPRPAVPGSSGGSVALVLPEETSRRVRALARREGATLFMPLLAAWQLLLARYSGQDDVSVGTPVAGRTRLETEGLIGFFVNTLVLRADLSGDPTFAGLLGRVRETTLGAYQHQDLPFERLVDELAPERSLSHTPLFQAAFVLQNNERGELRMGALEVEPLAAEGEAAKFDLTLGAGEDGERIGVTLSYRAELFERATAGRMLGHLAVLLEGISARPEAPLSALPLLGAAERRQVVEAGLAAHPGVPRETTIHRLFEAAARRAPEAVAVSFEGDRLTYAELDARAGRLARHLRSRGVGPEARVALLLERGPGMVAAILGVLRAGGAYVPVDPAYPAERIRYVLEDSGCVLVVAQDDLRAILPGTGVPVLSLDAVPAEGDHGPDLPEVLPGNAAYVIYTSGSTGRPKGVVVTHANVVRLFGATQPWFGFGAEDVWTLFHSYAFDFSVWEMWGALLHGGRLVVVPRETSRDPAAFRALLAREAVTVLSQTPSAFRQLAAVESEETLALEWVIFGGEALEPRGLRGWMERHGAEGPRLVNMYGITETTVHVTWREIGPADVEAGEGSPVGTAIPDLHLHLLGQGGEPVPAGVPGEICVGGAGVARGYLGRLELTAETFVPDPFSGDAGARLYRSGDRGLRRAGGEVEYLGRIDQQVKVRGFRIEPGEIEAALERHAGVASAAVVVREDGPGERHLVGYYTAAGEAPPAAELRAHLKAQLPEHMVPAALVALERLPLTAHGKLDRRALPAPEAGVEESGYEAPRGRVEEVLARVWAEVLRRERVGRRENFFEAGGDSILSIQMVVRARRAGVEVTPRQIFEHPTLAELARVAGRTGDLPVRAEQGVVTGEVPLTPVQHWFFGEEVPARHHWNQALLLDARSPLDPVLLERAWTALAGHHDALRMRFTHAADGWRQENAPDGEPVRVERIDLASLPAEEQPAEIDRAGARVQRSLDLAAGPLLRVALFERGADRPQEMLVVIHHLVVDGVSWRVLLEDLETAYGQLSRGEAVVLPAKTTSFRDWALRLAEHARSGGFDAELAYWEAGAGGSTPIPVDHPARTGANTVASARTVAAELTEEETAALLSEVPAAYHTQVNDALLAALAATLGEWTGGAARVELEGHGREEHLLPGTDLSRTVGWFTTLYPVVLEAGGSPGDTLKRVKERLRAAPERGIGYGGLRHLASGETRDRLAALPRPQVAFNYLGQLDRAASAETLFSLASGAAGDMTDPASTRPHLLTVSAGVEGGRLRVGWSYGEAVHRRSTVERLAERYVEALRELIAHCTSEEAGGWTPSDFPLAGLDQAALDALLGRGRDVEDVYPLTPMQEGMLFHALYSPEGGAYVEQFGFELEGTLDVEAFRRAWQGVVERHTVLRSGFAWEGVERAVQVVRRGGEVPLAVEDWRGVPAEEREEREERLEAYLRADRAEGLALERGPLMRLALFRTEEERYRLVWTHHHLVLDGWSLPLVFREVVALYDAAVEGVEARLGEARPYRAYLTWLAGRDTAAAEAYWRAELAGFEAATPLAADRRGEGAVGHPSYDTRSALLDEADTRRLQGIARRHGLTANTVVQGAWALLLSRYSGEEDVVFGGVVSGRPAGLEGVEEMVGLFINTLPVRVRVWPRTPVGTWLREIQEREAERREHEHTPLVEVQKWSGVPAGEALFESLLVFENYPLEDVLGQRERRLRVRTLGSREQTGYPLTLAVFPGERMVLHAQYDRARFDADAVERMLGHLAALLRGIAARPGSPLDELPLLDAAERVRVVEEWNDTAAARPALPVHRLFAEQAARTPAAVAVKCGAERVTYAELDARAGRLARRLRALGAGPEARVGVALRRGVDSVAALLAVWKAGAVYVPLDPAYPAERLTYLLEDSGAAVLVTDRESESRLPSTPARVVRVDEEGEAPGEEGAAGPGGEAGCGSLAYVIYTSGSTGRPKGVGVEHGSLANLLLSAREAMGEDAGEVPALAPLSFDISLFEVLFPLLAGGTARIVPAERVSDPDALAEEVAEAATVHAVPALMGPLVRALRGRGAPGPLRFLVGGDRIPSELVAEMREAFPAAQVHVMYGPTETTVLTSTLAVPAGEAVAGSTMGRPLGNVRTYVCDAWGEPAPVGVAGELYIGGVQVARGYPGRPELTAERFLPDPFGGGPGARLYRTGDRVRWRADGVLEFLGRTDSQVKVRGFRIEPGEVEAALERHPAVLAAAVVVREDGPGERRLVGYYTSAGEAPPAAELRAHLKAQLPEHMVPAALVALERLPLTAHGKLDRRALPAPEARMADGEYERPRTEAEATLAGVWAEVLKRERVGVHDDFFELGGDSILSIQVVSRARRAGLHLTPRQLFENPSVAALAAVVGVAAGPAAEQGEVVGEVPLTPVQHGFFEQEVPERHHWNLPVLLTPREPLEPAALERALSRLAEHHDALRMRFREAEGAWKQENAPAGAPVPLDVLDLSALPEAERAAAIEREGARVQRSLDLADGPLFRAALFGLGAGGQRLLLVAHHLVMDGVSWRVLTEDLATALAGEPLPPKTTSFREWALRLAEHTARGGFDGQLPYWTDPSRAGVPRVPVDHAAGEARPPEPRTLAVELDGEATRALLRDVPQAYRTQVNDALLAALARSLAEWTGSPRVGVELEGHGREEHLLEGVDLSRTVGWFTTLYPVVLEAGGSPEETLKRVKERLRAVPERGVGYGALLYLGGDGTRARLSALPRPEVAFNYLGQLDVGGGSGAPFALAPEAAGPSVARGGRSPHLLTVNASVAGGRLRAAWSFDAAVHRPETVERLAERFTAELRALVAHCASPGAGGYTPSDFPLAGVDRASLDRLLGSERGIEDVYPLTPMQEGMLFHSLYEEGGSAYLGQFRFDLDGPLDAEAFRAAWQGVLDRHSALRTSFAWEGIDRPLQTVRQRVEIPFETLDWRDAGAGEREARMEAWLREDRAHRFDLGRAPLMRVTLFRLDEGLHHFVWTHHHMVLDGWSLSLVYRDVVAVYAARLRGVAAEPARGRPYREYVAWLLARDEAGAEGFWRGALAGAPVPTPFGVDRPAGAEADHGEGMRLRAMGGGASAAVREAARRHGLTPNTLVQGAWALLLSRYSGEEDVVFGATVSGRPAELEGAGEMVGLFINTLPVRARVAPEEGVLPWLRGLQARQAELREHEHTPLASVQRWSGVPAGERLFESILVFQNYPLEDATAGGDHELRVEPRGGIEEGGFPLTLSVTPGERIVVKAEYALARFDAGTVERMLEHLETVLGALAGAPEARVGDVALAGDAERRRLLEEWNGAPAAFPRDVLVHDLISARAAAAPGAVAVAQGARTLSYAELDAAAARLALRLRALGVGPEARVALVLDRSPELAVAVLAVLRAGGAFVPLDPDYPAGRLAFVLRDSDAALVLTRADLAGRLPEHRGHVVLVEAETGGEVETAPCSVHPGNLAYAIYTSGSTGRPKAAMVSHRSLVAYARAMRAELRLSPDDRVLQFASPGFDVVVEELFPAWTAGAAVVFPEGEDLGSPAELMRLVEARGVTGFELPTAYWHECVRQLAEDGLRLPACVRWVIVGGERVLPERLRAWAGLGVQLVHVFGLTETTVTSATLRLEAGDDGSRWPNLPIGTPTESSRVYVLDRAGHPAPMGVPGELWVGGEGVARGYLGRPELTAERYVPDPFGAPGARAYRTGDRVRWLADGKLEFLGRIDQQVKVRGFRIEPAEVEAVLAEHPGVGEAVVVVRDAGGGDRRLVAYLVPAEGAAPPVAELREHVARALPAYMVPSAFVALDRLPLTPHGKLDRRALPDPDAGSLAPEAPYEAPGTAAERALAAVWAEVLRVERVGVRDNFFELGGDSILSIQVVSRARRAGLHLSPRQLFENPTVAALAALAGAPAGPGAEQGEVAGEVELTPVQHWFFEQEVPEPHHWNMPLLLVPGEPLDAAALEEALARLATHHDALRTRFRRAGGGWRQEVAPAGARVPVETLDLSALPEAERAAAIEREGARVQRSLELAEGPLFRAALFGLGGGAQRLLLVVHHLVVDGVSWRVLVEDLETALAGGALPPKTTSFRAWAHRLGEHARAGGFDAEIPFWTDPARAEAAALPVDFEGAAPTHATLRQAAVSLDEPTTRALLRDAPRAYRTRVDDVLLTALARALEGWSGGRGALVELEGHGREEHRFEGVDLSRTVGWFTTQFPVLLSPGADAPPGEALKAVKERLRAVPHRGIGYGALRWLSADPETRARLAALPRPQVAFNYLGRIDEGAGDGGEAPFTLAREGVGASESPEGRPAHPLAFNARVAGGRLHVSLVFSEAVHRRQTAERLAGAFLAELRALVEHCASPEAGGCTPGDFPLAGLDQAGLDRLVGSGRDVEDVYPLSPMQEGMLFHTLLEPGGGAYVGQQGFALRGVLDRDAFRRAWESVVARHTALRSAFAWEGLERPLQTVRRRVEVELREEDWRDASPAERAERLDAFLREDRSRGLDPARAPLMRLALFRTGDAEHHLVWTFHQMMLDGWSLPLVFREAAAAYDAFRQGREPSLPAARPYRDYVAWLQRRDDAGAERFWRAELTGFSAPTPLVVDRPAGAGEAGHGAAALRLDEAATWALHAAARREGLTPNTLVQGAWALLLSRYSGEADVVFGVTTSGRPAELEGVEEAVGLFINTLPARVRIVPAAPLGGWLRGLQERQAAFREHEHVPLVRVQRWSAVPAGRPLFESLVVFENYPVEGVPGGGGGGLEIHPVDAREQGNYPLTLVVLPGARLTLDAQYDRARLDDGAVERMLGHLRNLLAGMAAATADAPLSALSLLDGEERRALVAAGLAAVPELPRGPSIHALFEAAARRAPDAAAVTFEGEPLAYGELNRRANLLAHHLRSRGVGPEVRVALLLERGPEMVVAMLAVLKAGGAYVPVDPSAPADRVRWVLEDCGAPLVLTQRALAGTLPDGGAEAVLLDAEWPRIAAGPAHDPEGGAGPDGLAYVIYTSGSTGTPKGVQVEHHSVVRLFRATEEWFGFGPQDVWTLFHSYAFDFSVWEAWGALLYGGRLVVVPAATSRDPEAFHALVAREGVTVLSQTPSAFRPFAEVDGERGGELALRLVVFGGEALEPSSLRPWVARHGDAQPRLVNMYGITETTVHVTCRPLTRADVDGEVGSVIGVPIPDLSLHLLGPDGEPVPVGVPGEICVGGAGVARGYLNRPELTAERFVGDPFGEGRLYRSGDLARRRADGELEYLGRADSQVKVRGFRIEPGEVEAALRALPGVRDAVVVARADGSGDLRLVGYVVGGEEGAPPADAMREALRGRLPEYMVPSALVPLEAIPLTANGKTDRAALPAPEGAAASAGAYVAPRTPEEEALAAIWAEVLGVERVGVHQDFFEAGGHSLLVMRVVSRVRERFRVDLPLSAFFDAPTVAGLAAEVARRAPVPPPADSAPSAAVLPDDVDDLSEEELDALLASLAAEEEPES